MKNKSPWQTAFANFESKALRERLLMLFAAAALSYFLIDTLLLTPQQKRYKAWTLQGETQQAETGKISEKITQLSARLVQNKSIDKRAELDALIGIIAQADALLSEDDGGSLKLTELLKTMLRTTPGLKLMSLKTLPVVPLIAAPKDNGGIRPAAPMIAPDRTVVTEPPATAVHQHGVEIVVKGNYLALLPYLEKLHRYPKRLFWTDARLEVGHYPDATLRLTIHTLSEQKVMPLR